MNNREADRRPSVDNPNTIDDEKEVEIQIEKSDSPSSSSYARSDDINISSNAQISSDVIGEKLVGELRTIACPSCGHHIPINHQGGIWNDLPGMPAGVKFDPTDVQIIEHLEAKVQSNYGKLHPLVDEYIQTLEGENGICYTHPEKLPGLSKDGLIRHYFHRPSKAYTTGTRKRRKVSVDEDVDGSGSSTGSETRWHKTGKTRAVVVNGTLKGFKKILVLYTNYGRQKKPEKTNWVMHQYHLGDSEEEKEGELVLSKVFYQTHPRNSLLPQQPQPISFNEPLIQYPHQHQEQQQQKQLMLQQVGSSTSVVMKNSSDINLEYYQPRFMSFGHRDQCVVGGRESNFQFIPNLEVRSDHDGPSSAGVDGRNKQKEQFEGDVRASN